jgi:hypothetical protein
VLKSTTARAIQQQKRLREERVLRRGQQRISRKWRRAGKDPDVEETLNLHRNWTRCACRWSNGEKQVRGVD